MIHGAHTSQLPTVGMKSGDEPPTRNPEHCAGLLTRVCSPVALRTQTAALDQETRAPVQTRTVTAKRVRTEPSVPRPGPHLSFRQAAMVKLASKLSHELEKRPPTDHGFDNVPLITPLEVDQLQHSFAEKVRTRVFVDAAKRQSLSGRARRYTLVFCTAPLLCGNPWTGSGDASATSRWREDAWRTSQELLSPLNSC